MIQVSALVAGLPGVAGCRGTRCPCQVLPLPPSPGPLGYLNLIIVISRSAGWLLSCSGLSIDTTGTPEPSSLTSPEHFFSTKSTKMAV